MRHLLNKRASGISFLRTAQTLTPSVQPTTADSTRNASMRHGRVALRHASWQENRAYIRSCIPMEEGESLQAIELVYFELRAYDDG